MLRVRELAVRYLSVALLLAVGCDGVVGSTRRPDACGVCGGDNSTCRLVSGLFTRPTLPRVGYHLIAQLPRGACNITVTELKHSRNYLALRTLDDTYIINGNWAISWSGEYQAAGTVVTYRHQDMSHLETVSAPGPLMEPLDIMVIYQQPNPGIKYEYTLPMKMDAVAPSMSSASSNRMGGPPLVAPPLIMPSVPPPQTLQGTGPRGKGPVRPGEDLPHDMAAADAASERRTDVVPVPSSFPFDGATVGAGVQGTESQPHQPQPRNRGRKRKFAWRAVGYTECTRTCGGGVQSPIMACVREHTQTPVPERRCSGLQRPALQMLRCGVKPCPAEWAPGEWGQCSATCGLGVQTRSLLCQQQVTASLLMTVSHGACLAPEPSAVEVPRSRPCVGPPCDNADAQAEAPAAPGVTSPPSPFSPAAGRREVAPLGRWHAGPWSKCSGTCGLGRRTREVHCESSGISPNQCSFSDRPHEQEACDLEPCGELSSHNKSNSVWLVSEWSQQCSAPCGTGVQARRVLCWPAADEAACEVSSRPSESRACASDKQCPGQWFAAPWGQCSARCGRGRQSRIIACVAMQRGVMRVVSDSVCPHSMRPEHERSCLGHDCGPDWFSAEWSPCSKECGSGIQRREVRCLDQHQRPSNECAQDRYPVAKRACNTHECGTPVAADNENNDNGSNGLKDDPVTSHTTGDQGISDESASRDDECIDTIPNCHLVVQARLCTLSKHYRTTCCHSCRKKL